MERQEFDKETGFIEERKELVDLRRELQAAKGERFEGMDGYVWELIVDGTCYRILRTLETLERGE